MLPVYQVGDKWTHDLTEDLFDTKDEAMKDYRRCASERSACRTGGCDD